MLRELRVTVVLFVTLFTLTGIGYPLLTLVVAQKIFPVQANGSLIKRNGIIIGSALIGQAYVKNNGAGFFHGRPSAAGNDGYDATNSSASNLAPGSKELLTRVKDMAQDWRDNGSFGDATVTPPLPVDLVTASGSGLDPDISVAGAQYQIARVASQTGVRSEQLEKQVMDMVTPRTFGILGEPRVNVLKLNLAVQALIIENNAAQTK